MKILVACEESQAVTIEMRRLGHEAYSCDIEPCSGGHPEWHLQVDALELLKMKWDKPLYVDFKPTIPIDYASRWRDAYNLSRLIAGRGDEYGKTWIAYRSKPKEDDHD